MLEETDSPKTQVIFSKPSFLTNTKFDHFDLPPDLLAGLDDAGFTHCTPIQAQVLPVSLTGQDVAGASPNRHRQNRGLPGDDFYQAPQAIRPQKRPPPRASSSPPPGNWPFKSTKTPNYSDNILISASSRSSAAWITRNRPTPFVKARISSSAPRVGSLTS